MKWKLRLPHNTAIKGDGARFHLSSVPWPVWNLELRLRRIDALILRRRVLLPYAVGSARGVHTLV